MKVYCVWTNRWEYDDYDSFVVVAENEDKALAMVKHKFRDYQLDKVHVDEVDLSVEQVIIGSFNAG